MFERQIRIPEPEEIKERVPLPANLKKIKAERDKAVSDVITGNSDKLIVIVGPCSAHAEKPVLDYVESLASCPEFTPTSRALRALATRVCSPSPTRPSPRIF